MKEIWTNIMTSEDSSWSENKQQESAKIPWDAMMVFVATLIFLTKNINTFLVTLNYWHSRRISIKEKLFQQETSYENLAVFHLSQDYVACVHPERRKFRMQRRLNTMLSR